MSTSLDQIIKYGMDDFEAKAFKIALMWQKVSKKEMPNHKPITCGSRDPRKSLLFKYCYRLVKSTLGLIPDDQYGLYVLAQFHIIKAYTKGEIPIEPRHLVGIKAWRRWLVWKRKYDIRLNATIPEKSHNAISNVMLTGELNRTRAFLEKQLGPLTKEKIQANFLNIVLWTSQYKVSPYYAVLTPLVPIEYFKKLELEIYRECVDANSRELFRELFAYEYI